MNRSKIDPKLDLVFERTVDVPRELIWDAWTRPEQLKKWFTPAPWKTVDCEIDLTVGGIFRTVMQSPEGQSFPQLGCYLEIVKNERLIWTNALHQGLRPASTPTMLAFTAVLTFEAHGKGTKYTAHVLHSDEATRKKHEEMGFHDGWAKAFEQLLAQVKR